MPEPDIRFTLANERTFLAWVRTSIGLVAAGVALFHFLDESAGTTAMALILLGAGAVCGAWGYLGFHEADRAIRSGEPLPTNRVVPILLTCAVLLAVAAGAASVLM